MSKPNINSYSEYDTAADTTFTSVEISPASKKKEVVLQQNNNSPVNHRKPPPRATLITQAPVWQKPPNEISSDSSMKHLPRTRPDLKTNNQPDLSSKPLNSSYGRGKSQEEPLLSNRPAIYPKPLKKPRPNLNKSQESLC